MTKLRQTKGESGWRRASGYLTSGQSLHRLNLNRILTPFAVLAGASSLYVSIPFFIRRRDVAAATLRRAASLMGNSAAPVDGNSITSCWISGREPDQFHDLAHPLQPLGS